MTLAQRRAIGRWLPIALVVLATGALYSWNLSSAPVYLGGDEARFGSQAHAIASSGRDLSGRFMPLLIRIEDLVWWYQPTLFYLIAITLKFLPLAEGTIRIPTVLIAILDVWLLAAVIRKLLPDRGLPVIGAAMLAMTPAHFIFARQARDFICVLPFVLGWLWCLLTFLATNRAAIAVLAGAILGVGVYTHIAAWLFMPLYALLTVVVLAFERKKLAAVIGFGLGILVPLLPLLIWVQSHPGVIRTILTGYRVYDARQESTVGSVKALLAYDSVQERVSVYWDSFNPAYLFFSGGSNLTTATRQAGVFPVAFAVLLIVGVYELWRRRRSPGALLLLVGLATAPLGLVLVDDRYAIQRELVVIPFGVLVATFGVAFLFQSRARVVVGAALLLLATIPIQFVIFHRDYLTAYQARSAHWFDPSDFRDVAQYLLGTAASSGAPAIYVSNTVDDAVPRWRFYLAKHGREDLWRRTQFFSRENLDVGRVPPGGLLVLYPNDPQVAELTGPGGCCSVAHRVSAVGGSESAIILVR
jgi:hypothetical protein